MWILYEDQLKRVGFHKGHKIQHYKVHDMSFIKSTSSNIAKQIELKSAMLECHVADKLEMNFVQDRCKILILGQVMRELGLTPTDLIDSHRGNVINCNA